MQSKRKAQANKKHLSHLEELFDSGVIGVKEFLTSASFLVGKMPGQNYGGDEVVDDIEFMTDQNKKEWLGMCSSVATHITLYFSSN